MGRSLHDDSLRPAPGQGQAREQVPDLQMAGFTVLDAGADGGTTLADPWGNRIVLLDTSGTA